MEEILHLSDTVRSAESIGLHMMLASMEILMTVVIVEISIVSLNASVVGIRLEARLCSGAELRLTKASKASPTLLELRAGARHASLIVTR